MSARYRRARRILRDRRYYARVRRRWLRYGCACGKHGGKWEDDA